jgi:hypothetical protein
MPIMFANNATSRLIVAIGPEDTELTLVEAHADRFPEPYYDYWFPVTLRDPATGEREICHCGGRVGNVLSVDRGMEGTAALSFPATTEVTLQLTAQALEYLMELALAN